MDKNFKKMADSLHANYCSLMNMGLIIASQIPSNTPKGGVYLFSEQGINLYAGRTKRKISQRVRGHFSRAGDCPFAWLLAREKTGKRATYKKEGSRKELLKDTDFKKVYENAKIRIKNMQVRYVGEPDTTRQALLEIYVAIAAKAKYNDFDTR
jgi:hypothetical protein